MLWSNEDPLEFASLCIQLSKRSTCYRRLAIENGEQNSSRRRVFSGKVLKFFGETLKASVHPQLSPILDEQLPHGGNEGVIRPIYQFELQHRKCPSSTVTASPRSVTRPSLR